MHPSWVLSKAIKFSPDVGLRASSERAQPCGSTFATLPRRTTPPIAYLLPEATDAGRHCNCSSVTVIGSDCAPEGRGDPGIDNQRHAEQAALDERDRGRECIGGALAQRRSKRKGQRGEALTFRLVRYPGSRARGRARRN